MSGVNCRLAPVVCVYERRGAVAGCRGCSARNCGRTAGAMNTPEGGPYGGGSCKMRSVPCGLGRFGDMFDLRREMDWDGGLTTTDICSSPLCDRR